MMQNKKRAANGGKALRRLMKLDYVVDIFEEEELKVPMYVFNRIEELQVEFVKSGKEVVK